MSAQGRRLLCIVAVLALAVAQVGPVRADNAPPTTQADSSRASLQERLNPQNIVNRIRARVHALNLSDDQSAKINDILDRAQQEATALEDEIRDLSPIQKFVRLTPFVRQLRQRLGQILTPEQVKELREQATTRQSQTEPPPVEQETSVEHQNGLAIGAPLPELRLMNPGGTPFEFRRGRVFVMEFGSISCPSFRDHVLAMNHLALHYSTRATFLIVYTREAHPQGQWEVERNRDDSIFVPQPADLAARRQQAEDAREALHIEGPLLVDSMEDTAANALDGFPNATVIIGRDGKIFARQKWTDPFGLPRLIDAALTAK